MEKTIKAERFATILEMVVVAIIGITAVLTAYASWQSSLYGGNQATKYATGTAILGEANSMYNEASQFIAQDMGVWNRISELRIDKEFAESRGAAGAEEVERSSWKLDQIIADNVSDEMNAAIVWADAQTDYASPFDKEGYIDSYYTDAEAKYQEGQKTIADGQNDNRLGDILGLVTVIFAVVLFMLGIVSTFKNSGTKIVVTIASLAALTYGILTMLSVPMLTL